MPDKKLNILFLTGWYPNRLLPFDGNFVQKHAEAVAMHSNVFALHACSDAGCIQKFEIVENNINQVFSVNVYYKKVNHSIPLLSSIQKGIRYATAYLKGFHIILKKAKQIDLIHHHILYPSGIIACYLKKTKKIPYLVTEHSTIYLASTPIKIKGVQKTLSKIVAAHADIISPVSEDLGNAMKQLGFKSTYCVVPNVVDIQLFYPEQKYPSPLKIKLVHISSLNDVQKNITGMLKVIARLAEKRKDFECSFIGFGDLDKHIKLAKELNIYNRFVFFEGAKTSGEIATLMRKFDGLMLYSFYENLPCVLVEAMACGLPVISTSVGGIAEHLSSEHGMLVQSMDETGYLNKMDEFINQLKTGYYNPVKIRQYANDHFSNESVSKQYHRLYRLVLNKKLS